MKRAPQCRVKMREQQHLQVFPTIMEVEVFNLTQHLGNFIEGFYFSLLYCLRRYVNGGPEFIANDNDFLSWTECHRVIICCILYRLLEYEISVIFSRTFTKLDSCSFLTRKPLIPFQDHTFVVVVMMKRETEKYCCILIILY
jgi:hypothetical protein